MQLTVDQLAAANGFAGGAVKREVTWTREDGETFTFDVYVKKLSYHTLVSDIQAFTKGTDVTAERLVRCIVDESGAPVFRLCDITGYHDDGTPVMAKNENGEMVERGALDQNLAWALLEVIGEVNKLGKKQPPTLSED